MGDDDIDFEKALKDEFYARQASRMMAELTGVFNVVTTVRYPFADYLADQRELLRLRSRARDSDGLSRILHERMRYKFKREFGLEESRSRFDWSNKLRSLLGDDDRFLDHTDYFRRGCGEYRNEVITVQPYGWHSVTDPEVVSIAKKLLTVCGELVDLNDWAYYYPGKTHASCWGMVFQRASQSLLDYYEFCGASHIFK